MTARLQFLVQDIKVSSEYVDFYTKESLILDTRVRISATQLTLIGTFMNQTLAKNDVILTFALSDFQILARKRQIKLWQIFLVMT